jgi:hypothetical protein
MSEDYAAVIFRVKMKPDGRWRQHGPLKHWDPTTSIPGVMTQKTTT